MERVNLADGGWYMFAATFLERRVADRCFAELRDTMVWQQEGARGRLFPRLVAWCADPGVVYTYSGIRHESSMWTPVVQEIRTAIAPVAGTAFNSVLLNYYRDGRDSMGFHADAEPELGTNPVIGSISLGATRRFVLKHKTTAAQHELMLSHGSLLVMGGTCQHFWKHAIPKTARPTGPRINLTFRRIAT